MASISIGLAELVEQEVNKLAYAEANKTLSKKLSNEALSTIAIMSDDKITNLLQSELANLVVNNIIDKLTAKKIFKDTIINKSKLEFVNGTADVINKVDLKISKGIFNKNITKVVSERSKVAQYNRMAKRQINIYANQIKTDGIEVANKKLKVRTSQILNSEKGYYKDQGKLNGAREVNINTNKFAMKKWVHGMYGTPKTPRDLHVSANGQYADIDGMFYVAGERVSAPREFSDISQNINCHCGIEIVIK